jgi:[ribosomal protein S18]-alanine N-acetyltransferase
MSHTDSFTITQTTDLQKIAVCAKMMYTSDPWVTYKMDYDLCLKAFEGECKEIYMLEIDNSIEGFAILQIGGTFKGYIQSLCVSEAMRGKGWGKKLLQFCEERILKISPNIFICVSSFNKGAAKLYYEFGFELVGELHGFLKHGLSELLLRKTFGPVLEYHAKLQ